MSKKCKLFFTNIFNIRVQTKDVGLSVRYLVFYLLFLKIFFNSSNKILFKFSFKKIRKNIIVFTKAPYRFKLSKHQVFFSRFKLIFYFFFNIFFSKYNLSLISKFFFFFSSIDFCFYSLDFCKLAIPCMFTEWLR